LRLQQLLQAHRVPVQLEQVVLDPAIPFAIPFSIKPGTVPALIRQYWRAGYRPCEISNTSMLKADILIHAGTACGVFSVIVCSIIHGQNRARQIGRIRTTEINMEIPAHLKVEWRQSDIHPSGCNLSLLHSDNRSALFPLNSVLFPGCILALQIFEQRYLRLIKTCMRDDHGFVVILISSGKEIGDAPETYSIGTYVEIIDWETLENGLFGITIKAKHRVRVTNPSVQDDGLMTGEIEKLSSAGASDSVDVLQITDLVDILKQLEQHPYIERQPMQTDYTSTQDVCHKLSQLLPLDPLIKQSLLEIDSNTEKIDRLRDLINRMQQ
jgi:Lon protease-like protein